MSATADMRWADLPKAKNLEAAGRYLRLRYDPAQAARLVRKLRDSEPESHHADDVLRACRQDPVDGADLRVQHELDRLLAGKKLAPPLIVVTDRGAEIANGVHALSLAFHSDPHAAVPVVIARDF